jgi:dipeptidyl aminopeptidase/acylaminoacyl peptidase
VSPVQERKEQVAAVQRSKACDSLLLVAVLMAGGSVAHGGPQEKLSITVANTIEMTRLADPDYFVGGASEGRVAHFSPDGKSFLVVLEKGDLQRNTNQFSLLLFRTDSVFRSPKPDLLLTMSSSSNRDGIKNVKWLGDNETLVFLGENPGEKPAIYSFNIRDKQIKRLTKVAAEIDSYDISEDGRVIVFTTLPSPTSRGAGQEDDTDEIVIHDQGLADLVAGRYSETHGDQLFSQLAGQLPVPIPLNDSPREGYQSDPISISPNGRYALIEVYVRDVPVAWSHYREKGLRRFVEEKQRGGD